MVTKTELVAEIARKTGLTQKDAHKAVTGFTEAITEFLAKGEKIQLIDFGTFEPRVHAARKGRNPANGTPLVIPQRTVASFKAGKKLRKVVGLRSKVLEK